MVVIVCGGGRGGGVKIAHDLEPIGIELHKPKREP